MVLSGRNARLLPHYFFASLIRLAACYKVRALLDTHHEPFAAGLKAKPFMIKPNRAEAEAFFGKKLNTTAKIKGWRSELKPMHGPNI